LVGLHKAKELALYGDWIDASEAHRLGLVNRVFPAGELADAARDWAERLAAQQPTAVTLIKQSLNRSFERSMAEALEEESVAQAQCSAAPEFRAALETYRRPGD